MISMLYTGPAALTGAGVGGAAASAPEMSALAPSNALAARPSLRCSGARRASMCAILMEPGRFAEAPQQTRGKLEAGALGGQLSRHAQLQWSLEAVLARAGLDGAHHGGRIDRRALLEQHRAALWTQVEPAHSQGARREFESGDAQQAVRRGRRRAKAIVDFRAELIECRVAVGGGDALVERQAHVHVADVRLRQERRQAQLDLGGGGQRLVEHRLAPGLEGAPPGPPPVPTKRKPRLRPPAPFLAPPPAAAAPGLQGLWAGG